MAVKDTAQLTSDNAADIGAASAPNSINPTLDAQRRKDLIDSLWNKEDGITVGSPYDTALVVPATFNATIHDGDDLRDIVQALMDQANQDHISITGGVQGRQGEFLANITPETKQTFSLDDTNLSGYQLLAKVKFVNDKDGGCFDNGNNWLVDQFITPTGGQPSMKDTVFGLIIDIISSAISANSGSSGWDFKFEITKNGSTLLSTSNVKSIRDGSVPAKLYFNDFDTGGTGIVLAANETIECSLYYQTHNLLVNDAVTFQLSNGSINHKIL